jgi:fibronectin type 3 domain-containing protein
VYRLSWKTSTATSYTAKPDQNVTSYTDTGLTNGTTYDYIVRASKDGSCWSDDSAPVTATPMCLPPSVPVVTATPGNAKVALSWTASTGGSPGGLVYTIQHSTTATTGFTQAGTATATSYTDTGLTNGTDYFFKVNASNGSCASADSAVVTATPTLCAQAQPTLVKAIASGSKQVTLNWTAGPGAVATSYDIGRSTTSGQGYISVGSVDGSTLAFTDSDPNLVSGTTYYYVVTANSTCLATSNELAATPVCAPPSAPTAVTATNDNSNGHIRVAWNTSANATGYTVARGAASAGPFTAVSTNQTAVSFSDNSALTSGATYYYVVSASNASGVCASANSSPAASAMSCAMPAVPIAPTAARTGNAQVTLNWTASTGATSYNVLRSTTSGSGYASIATPTSATFTDSASTGLTNGSAYYYVITANNGAGGNCASANSTQVSVPLCHLKTGSNSEDTSNINTTDPYCVVTCDDLTWWGCYELGNRTISINGTTQASCGHFPLPAKGNGGYAISLSSGTDRSTGVNWGGTGHGCP